MMLHRSPSLQKFFKKSLFVVVCCECFLSTQGQAATPLYEVNNGASSGANSFPAALTYVNTNGGNVTFGPGAYNQTCTLGSAISITHPISVDLTGLSPGGDFSLNGGNGGYYIAMTGASPATLTFLSSTGSGNFSFIGSSFANQGSSSMNTMIGRGATLTLLHHTGFTNYGTYMATDVYGTLALLESSLFWNYGSGTAACTVHSGGLLSMDTAGTLYGHTVNLQGGGTFASGSGGAFLQASTFFLLPTATHQVEIGTGSHPIQVGMWAYNGKNSTVTLENATLNVVNSQNFPTLQGNTYLILTADPGSSIIGQYGNLQFNGVSTYLPYEMEYLPNSSATTSVNVIFPPANRVRNNASDPSVPYSFPAALDYVNANGGNITFGAGARGQIYKGGNSISIVTHPLIFDLTGLGSAGFSINGGGDNLASAIEATGSGPVGLTFVTSSGAGSFSFLNSSRFLNEGSGAMMTTIEAGATLSLSHSYVEHSYFVNDVTDMTTNVHGTLLLSNGSKFFATSGSGAMLNNVYGMLTLSGESAFQNSATGPMITTVNTSAMLTLSRDSSFLNYAPNMTTNVNGVLTLSDSSFVSAGAAATTMTTNIYGGRSLLSNSYFANFGTHIMTNVYGELTLLDGSYVANGGSGAMTTTIEAGGNLILSGSSLFVNSGSAMTNDLYGSVSLERSSAFQNHGTSMETNVYGHFTLTDSFLQNFGSNITATHVYGTLVASNGWFETWPSEGGTLTLHSGGLLSVDRGTNFYGEHLNVESAGIFASGIGGAFFQGSSLNFSPNATHQAAIGMGGQPMQMLTWNGKNSTVTLGRAILNVVSPQSLESLRGNTYPLWTASEGNRLFGQYGAQQFNGSSVYLPFEVQYLPNASYITTVNVAFPALTKAPSLLPTTSPSRLPSPAPSTLPSNLPSLLATTVLPTLAHFANSTTSPLALSPGIGGGGTGLGWQEIVEIGAAGIGVVGLGVCIAVKPIREAIASACASLWDKTTSCLRKPRRPMHDGDESVSLDSGISFSAQSGNDNEFPESHSVSVSMSARSDLPFSARNGWMEDGSLAPLPSRGPVTREEEARERSLFGDGQSFLPPLVPIKPEGEGRASQRAQVPPHPDNENQHLPSRPLSGHSLVPDWGM